MVVEVALKLQFSINMGIWGLSIQGIRRNPLGKQCTKRRGKGGSGKKIYHQL